MHASSSSHSAAFGGLLGTFASADAAAGGPDAGAGGHVKAQAKKKPLQVPPQPSPPVRMPRKSHHLLDPPSSACSWGSSSVCSSASSSRASLSGLVPGASADDDRQAGTASCSTGAPGGRPSTGLKSAAAETPAPAGSKQPTPAEPQGGPSVARGGAATFVSFFSGGGYGASVEDPVERPARKKSHELSDYSNYCCFRDGRKPRRNGGGGGSSASASSAAATSSPCAAIREEHPETTFPRDETLLELRSVLRSHSVEPSDALVGELLRWQAKATKAAVAAAAN
mmetsp:Transcript_69883/g.202790  ORF Transcript_69883/g.202790 Transcript_69883/m.202790 type:complete len:283 (-) Transcript_69883:191-1039(-)|eukprot:CAMPEP_0176120542 /NCGR_PEP_ID=MMETSP0120_2-20121206/60637_1 /TAXON_ID=160619 /ORGANISM="Kryptoperidinium foliaceum, Strain CCMP 1326" /LENGTH=282 /DNA_ID=CAMNT_0017455007 /DNA_START=51 /DNA_END=899 /DNA_ORIENTATION=+